MIRSLLLLGLIWLSVAAPVWAAIAEVGTPSCSATSADTTTHSFAHDNGTGSDRVTVCWVGKATTQNFNSVTLGGTSMTFVVEAVNGAGQSANELWYITNPPVGSATVALTSGGVSTNIRGGCLSYSGVRQTTPLGTAAMAVNPSASTFPLSVTSETGHVAVSALVRSGAGDTPSADAPQTQRFVCTNGGGTIGWLIGSSRPGASPSVSFDYSWDASTYNGAHAGVSLIPSGAAPAPRRPGVIMFLGWLDSWWQREQWRYAWVTGEQS